MADWRKFIDKRESIVLPYFGGARVRLKDREVRVDAIDRENSPGWFTFEISGRNAKFVGPADPNFAGLTKVRGVLAGASLFVSGALPERVALMPADEPPMFASCTCYRWHDGTLIFGELDFEGEVEEAAREAFAEKKTLEWVKGASAPLRAAFAWGIVKRVSQEKKIPCSVREAWPRLSDIVDGGDEVAATFLDELEVLRHGRRVIVAGQRIHARALAARATAHFQHATIENAVDRATEVMHTAGARVVHVRRLDRGHRLEVVWEFGGERFISVADALTLNVIDAGICLVDHLDGHRGDGDLTLDSLPSAIREAIDLGVLVITRR